MTAKEKTKICASRLGFRYSEAKEKTLADVNFTVRPGEIVFISGESGSGKSTLLNLLNGIIPEIIEGELEGCLELEGRSDWPIHERNRRLGLVFQNPRSQFFTTNTTAELVFGMENQGYSCGEMKNRLQEIITEFHIEELLHRDIFALSSGERQFLALMCALIMKPTAVIFDEPSANLDYGNVMRLRRQLIQLKDRGMTVLVADHRCFYLKDIMDHVLFLKGGTITEFLTEEEYFASGYANRVSNLFEYPFEQRRISTGEQKTVSLEHVGYKNILKDVSIDFHHGEVTTLVGVNGVGKSTLAKLVAGILKPSTGEMKVEGQPLFIMQDADFQLFGASCLKELQITCKDDARNRQALARMGIGHLCDRHPQTLSGGEKQRLQLALSLVSPNEVIILDEPTSGLDQISMRRVVAFVEEMKRNHTLIVISHDYEFIRLVTDKIVYLKEGALEERFHLTDENIENLNRIFCEMEHYYE